MAPPTDRLYVMARSVLDAIIDNWPGDAEPLPDRQFVANGQIIWDCEELAVGVERTYSVEADPGVEQFIAQGPGYTNRAAVIACALIRCVPDLKTSGNKVEAPAADLIEASAAMLLADEQSMFSAILAGQRSGAITSCQGLAFDSWTSEGPEGALGGGVLRVRILLN